VANLEAIVEKLCRAQHHFLTAADQVPADQWKTRPSESRWSAAELICHLGDIERAILTRTDHVLQKTPRPVPFYKRFHVPMIVVEARLFPRKSPFRIESDALDGKEEMLARFREVRERTLAFLQETKGRDLGKYIMPHPFLGGLNGYEWFQFVASHQIRHTKQMREIANSLPKIVESLQK
jgi:uncharacterized damage-inducible protein DinB